MHNGEERREVQAVPTFAVVLHVVFVPWHSRLRCWVCGDEVAEAEGGWCDEPGCSARAHSSCLKLVDDREKCMCRLELVRAARDTNEGTSQKRPSGYIVNTDSKWRENYTVCAICGDGDVNGQETGTSNEIVFCDGDGVNPCGLPVHLLLWAGASGRRSYRGGGMLLQVRRLRLQALRMRFLPA